MIIIWGDLAFADRSNMPTAVSDTLIFCAFKSTAELFIVVNLASALETHFHVLFPSQHRCADEVLIFQRQFPDLLAWRRVENVQMTAHLFGAFSLDHFLDH